MLSTWDAWAGQVFAVRGYDGILHGRWGALEVGGRRPRRCRWASCTLAWPWDGANAPEDVSDELRLECAACKV